MENKMETTCILETSNMGKTKKINHRIKKTLAKIFQETHLKWDQACPIALLQIRVAPKSGLKLSPLEIVYSRLPAKI